MTIAEKVSYIQGLAEGMKINDSTNEGKITLAMLDVLKDIALTLEEVDDDLDDMAEVVSDIEESVYDLEDAVYGEDDDDDFEDEMYEVVCDKCGNTITIDYGTLEEGAMDCPNCGEHLEFDLSMLDGECDCGCHN